jgi:Sortase domain
VRPSYRRRIAMAGLLVMAGCGGSRDVILGALSPPSMTRVGPAPTPTTPVPAPTTAAPVPPTTSAASPLTTAAPPAPTTTAVSAPAVATHDATLSALPSPRGAVPVAVDAGGTAFISGPVVGAGVDTASGELAVPADASVVAWYEYGPAPGEAGSAVLAGHVDWHGVPGVFFRLRELQAGDPVTVTMSDGTVLGFHVVDARLVDKPELPRAEVFARAGPPTLRLVTCGGEFDSSTHHYRSNMVVTAVPD